MVGRWLVGGWVVLGFILFISFNETSACFRCILKNYTFSSLNPEIPKKILWETSFHRNALTIEDGEFYIVPFLCVL